ncbi:uncharacterized protein il11b [Genypterus blacodes]|uniref:uncharacterized protein il11b n=1 Tax=Genypterus blacodes TaxID=154954 RepID=UPI003F770AD5
MKLIPDSAPCLLRLLLLAQLFVHSAPLPVSNRTFCRGFREMKRRLDNLSMSSSTLHSLGDDELVTMAAGNRLGHLPNIEYTAADISSIKLNAALSQLYVHTQAFKLHLDWLNTASNNISVPSQPAGDASAHLHALAHLLQSSLQQEPELTSYSLPEVSSTFDLLHYAAEISERLKVFCDWSKRLLAYLRKSHCL